MLKGLRNDRKKDYFVGIVLSTLLCAVSVSAPIVGFFCFLLLPLPIIFYRVKLGRKSSGIIFISSFLLVAFLAGGFAVDIFFLLGIMGLGFLIGEGIYNNLPVEKNILYASGVILFAAACSLIIYGNLSNTGAIGVVSDYISKNIALTISLYKEMGMPDETIRMLTETENEIRHILIRIFPALFTSGLLVIAWGNFLLARLTLKKKGILTSTGTPLNIWKAPEWMVWGIVGSIGVLLIPNALIKIAGLNGLIIFMTIYFFQGIAIISFYLEKKKFLWYLRYYFTVLSSYNSCLP